jgi:hypothetical protein
MTLKGIPALRERGEDKGLPLSERPVTATLEESPGIAPVRDEANHIETNAAGVLRGIC